MKGKRMLTIPIMTGVLAFVGSWAISAQDKYTLKVPNGLSFSEFRGYEAWQVVSISQDGNLIAAILANPEMIKAYLAGVPGTRFGVPTLRNSWEGVNSQQVAKYGVSQKV